MKKIKKKKIKKQTEKKTEHEINPLAGGVIFLLVLGLSVLWLNDLIKGRIFSLIGEAFTKGILVGIAEILALLIFAPIFFVIMIKIVIDGWK
jgi:UDP-N-acetylmuramyl pentapeptide phosphotransferase/UDP-N-acetylglucosamine-1-phosphate transferase